MTAPDRIVHLVEEFILQLRLERAHIPQAQELADRLELSLDRLRCQDRTVQANNAHTGTGNSDTGL